MNTKEIIRGLFFKINYVFTIIYIVVLISFYNILPWYFNLPEDTYNNQFQIDTDGTTWFWQYIIVSMITYIINILVTHFTLRSVYIGKNKKLYNDFNFKKRLLKLPRKLYLYVITAIMLSIAILHPISLYGFRGITIILLLVFSSIIIIISSLVNLFTTSMVKKIMTKYSSGDEEFDFKNRIITKEKRYIIPLFGTFLILILLTGYTVAAKENSNFLHKLYKAKFKNVFVNKQYDNIGEVERLLLSIKSVGNRERLFIYSESENNYYEVGPNSNEKLELSYFYTKYIRELSLKHDGIVYGNYGAYERGYVKRLTISNDQYYVGIKYDVDNGIIILGFVGTYLFLIGIFTVTTYSNKNSYGFLVDKFKSIVKDKRNKGDESFIPIISNDEFGELAYLYNQLSSLTAEYIRNLEFKHNIMIKQAQLASIGELATNIVKELNEPNNMIIEDLKELNKESKDFDENEKSLLSRMVNCADKIEKILNSVKNQMGSLDEKGDTVFKVSETIEDAKVVLFNEIIKKNCDLIVNIEDDLSVYGNKTKLGQVITNLVLNSIQAYSKQGGKIEVTVSKAPQGRVIIKIQDYATGISENVKDYIFKNILTTKGVSGTGLGLYISYTVIKGNFSGEMTFETEKNSGTTFYIFLPEYIEKNTKEKEKGD